MTQPLILVGIFSFIGAVFFFLAGYFFSRCRLSAAHGACGRDIPEPLPPLLEESRGITAPEPLSALSDAGEVDLNTELTKVQEAKCRCEDDLYKLALRVFVLQEKEKQVQKMTEKKIDLSETLIEARREIKELKNRVLTLEEEAKGYQALTLRLGYLDEKCQKMEELRESNVRLQTKANECKQLQEQIAALRLENSRLRSLDVVLDTPPRPASVSYYTEGLGNSLQYLVERLAQTEKARGVVLADDQGLLVAGTGEHLEGLAAAAAVFDALIRKVKTILPLSTPQRLTITDENSITLIAQPFVFASVQLILVNLSFGPGPDRETIDRLIAEKSVGHQDTSTDGPDRPERMGTTK